MVTAALLAALAAGVAIGPAPGPALVRVGPKQVRSRSASKIPRWAPLALVPIVVLPALLGIRTTLWLATAAVALGTVGWLVAGQRRRRRARLAAQECADGARILASLLRSGQIPTAALSEAAKECPQFQPAAAASALGADVSSVLRDRSTQPGCEGLGAVAAAWSVSERSGAPVAQVLARVAADLRRRLIGLFVVGPDGQVLGRGRNVREVVDSELAAARATGQIMAVLPFAAIGLGFAAGTNPVAFLVGGVPGQLLLLAGVLLTAAGVLWIDKLAAARGAT